jgi:hypothetical protein
MATTIWRQMGMVWLDPGKTLYWKWNNAKYNCVYAFNVSPIAQQQSETMEAEIVRVWRTHSQKTTAAEAEVHYLFKNTSSVGGYAFVFMSEICP